MFKKLWFNICLHWVNPTVNHIPRNFRADFYYNSNKTYYAIALPRPEGTTFKLEVWGSSTGGYNPGKGGYSYGNFITESDNQRLYIVVGGQGGSSGSIAYGNIGGYNGGGNGQFGGGATHIALTNRGVLSNYNSYRAEVLIVAGGAGTSDQDYYTGYTGNGGYGGGGNNNGGNGSYDIYWVNDWGEFSMYGSPGTGGTQTAGGGGYRAGGFGRGGDAVPDAQTYTDDSAPGGGGGWYGGGSSNVFYSTGNGNGASGGGSGHIHETRIAGGGGQNGVRSGHGFASITLLHNNQ